MIAIGWCGIAGAQPNVDETHRILRSVFDATGLDAREQRFFEARFDALARRVAASAGESGSPERRARRLHRYLHEHVLAGYRDDADGLDDVLGRGEFNCVSSTILEGLLAMRLGIPVEIASGTSHVALRVALPSHPIDVETTIAGGFDPQGRAAASERFMIADRLAETGAIPFRSSRESGPGADSLTRVVPLEQGAAFVWHNQAARALERGEGYAAAERLFAAERLYPGVASGPEGIQRELGRAFRADYEAGRLTDAYATAVFGVRLDPEAVPARERLIAVAARQMDDFKANGEPRFALALRFEVEALLRNADGGF